MDIFKVKDVTVLFDKKNNTNNVFIDFFFHIGASHEKEGKRGISHLVEHLVTRNKNQKRTKGTLKTLDSCGLWNAETSWDFTSYYVWTEKGKIKKTIKTLYDSIFNLEYSQKEFDLEKKVVIQELKDNKNTINIISERTLLEKMYGLVIDSPIIGKLEDLIELKKEQTIEWKDKTYRRKNMAIYVSGEVSKNYLERVLSKIIDIPYKGSPPKSIFATPSPGRKNIDFDNQRNSRVVFDMAYPFFKRGVKTKILNHLLGHIMVDGGNSILHQKLRTENGLVYYLTSEIYDFEAFKHFLINTECEKKVFNQVYDLIVEGINEINKTHKIKKRLDSAKTVTRIRSNSWYNQDSDEFFNHVILPSMKGKQFIPYRELARLINAIKPEEVYEHLKTLINNDYYIVLQQY